MSLESQLRAEIKKADARLKKAEKNAAEAMKEVTSLNNRLALLIVVLHNRGVIERDAADMIGI